jgi:HAD superfamily hydrolase (TIGR01509 family)
MQQSGQERPAKQRHFHSRYNDMGSDTDHRPPPMHGIIFDLDGTVVDSGLDFDLMRREMELPPGPILESLARLPEPRAGQCRRILEQHELVGARRATLMPGVAGFLDQLQRRGLRTALITRNSRAMTLLTIGRLSLAFDPIIAREDAPAKPDPAGLHKICGIWGVRPEKVVMLGDYRFDLEAGRRAGTRTVLYTAGRDPESIEYAGLADFHLRSYEYPDELLEWLGF